MEKATMLPGHRIWRYFPGLPPWQLQHSVSMQGRLP